MTALLKYRKFFEECLPLIEINILYYIDTPQNEKKHLHNEGNKSVDVKWIIFC